MDSKEIISLQQSWILTLQKHWKDAWPSHALVAGSGLSGILNTLKNPVRIPLIELDGFPRPSVSGHVPELAMGHIGSQPVACFLGRLHTYEGVSPQQAVMPIHLMKALGVTQVLMTNAVGGISESLEPGDLVCIQDHINLSGINPLTGNWKSFLESPFIDMSQAYSSSVRSGLIGTANALSIDVKKGVYAFMPGPSYETPAEIRMLRQFGADVVGMSTVPEVIMAHALKIEVGVLSLVTNKAAGMAGQLHHKDVLEVAKTSAQKTETLIQTHFENLFDRPAPGTGGHV